MVRQEDVVIPEVWLEDDDGRALVARIADVPLDVWSMREGNNRRFLTGADRPRFRTQGPQAYTLEHTMEAMLCSIEQRGLMVRALVTMRCELVTL